MAVIAITGDVGAGKSTVAELLAEKLNCKKFNADEIAKSLWQNEFVKNAAVSRWGSSVLDFEGNILKDKVASIIFKSKIENDWCNKLLHPLVFSELEKLSCREKNSVLEIPLLFEAGRPEWINYVIFVTAKFEVRAQRCKIQRGWSVNELLRREKFFIKSSERIVMSDFVILNEDNFSELQKQIEKINFNSL